MRDDAITCAAAATSRRFCSCPTAGYVKRRMRGSGRHVFFSLPVVPRERDALFPRGQIDLGYVEGAFSTASAAVTSGSAALQLGPFSVEGGACKVARFSSWRPTT